MARSFRATGSNMRSRAPPPWTRLCGTASTVGIRRGWFGTIRAQCERVPLTLCARWLSPEPTDHVRYRTCADGTVRPPQPSAGVGTWRLEPAYGCCVTPVGLLTPASVYTVQRRNWLNPGLGEHHGYPLGTWFASDRVARPRKATVSFRAPGAKSAPKGHPFRG